MKYSFFIFFSENIRDIEFEFWSRLMLCFRIIFYLFIFYNFIMPVVFKHFQNSIDGLENFIIERNMNWTKANIPAITIKMVRSISNSTNEERTTNIVTPKVGRITAIIM